MAEDLYVIQRIMALPARFELSEQEAKELADKDLCAQEDAGGEIVDRYGSYADKGVIRILKFPDLAAWEQYRKSVFKFSAHKYWSLEYDLCFKIGQ